MKRQLKNTGPITREMILAPVTKRALLQRERDSSVEILYHIPNVEGFFYCFIMIQIFYLLIIGLGPELLGLFDATMADVAREGLWVKHRRVRSNNPSL